MIIEAGHMYIESLHLQMEETEGSGKARRAPNKASKVLLSCCACCGAFGKRC
jgi:hypothetical protein